MPGDMSSENRPNIDPSVAAINSIGMEAAKNFPQPESKAHVPDIRMLLRDDETDKNNEAADALNNRIYYGHESLSGEQISSAETPQELFYGLRHLEKQLEDASIPFVLEERYTPPRELSVMYERASLLNIPPTELKAMGWIRKYDEKSGEAELKHRKYASVAMSVEDKKIVHKDEKKGQRWTEFTQVYKLGKPKERAELGYAYERAAHELEARAILGEHISLRTNLDFRDNLEGLVSTLHGGRMPKFKSEHLEALFNMPGVTELAQNPENTKLGDQVEEAMFLNLVMLNSGNKSRMQEFLKRPGAVRLIERLAEKDTGLLNEDDLKILNEEQIKQSRVRVWVHNHIGDVHKWKDDIGGYKKDDAGKMVRDGKGLPISDDRLLTDDGDIPATWRVEAADGRRGKLTKYSNISAWGGGPGEFSAYKEKDFIEDTIGGLVGSNEASWIAATIMRSIGAYASEGYVALPNGKSWLPLGEGRYISGDDTGKFYTYMFNMKEGLKGRASGLKDMIGKIPDMAMNLFDWAAVEMDDLPPKPNGTKDKRSIWDAWLGTTGGIPKLDLLTMKPALSPDPTKLPELTVEEPYHRLGSLNFKSLEREFHGTFTIMQWLMGNERSPVGVYIDAMKVDDFKYEDFSLNESKKRIKYIGIVMNPPVMTKGSTHLYDHPEKSVKVIQKNFFRNLMLARIHSASFNEGILNSKVKLFNPEGGGDAEVPAAVLVRAFVKEALKTIPEDVNEEWLIKHYIDENEKLRKMGKNGTPGIREDVSVLLTETFEPEDPKERDLKLTGYVGKVRGRKT